MRPYLAVIYDSWIEVLRSKVLWVLLFCWILLLAAIAPFGFINGASYRITSKDVKDGNAIVAKLRDAGEERGTSAQRAIFVALKESTRKKLIDEKKENRDRKVSDGEVAKSLNQVLDVRSLYSAEAWPDAARRNDLKELVEQSPESISTIDLQQRNRRLVELAFPGLLSPVHKDQIWIGYAGLKIGNELIISQQQTSRIVEALFIIPFMKLGLGIVAIFIAIVITSPGIPDMFQAGSLHLLLSKPISRSLLYLSKLVGGCIFVGINISFLLVGLYGIAGLRFGIWNVGILLCIPVFLFIFTIFYSVSSLAGLIWKNSIVSVVVTAIFWVVCLGIGLIHGVMKPLIEMQPQLVALKPIGTALFGVSHDGQILVWNKDTNEWKSGYSDMKGEIKVLGPLWLPKEKSMYFGRAWFHSPFGGGFNGEDVRLQSVSLPELGADESEEPSVSENSDAEKDSSDKTKDDLWSDTRVDRVTEWPARTRRVLEWDDSFVALTDRGLFRFNSANAKLAQKDNGIVSFLVGFFAKPQAFDPITPSQWQPEAPMDFTFTPGKQLAYVYSQGKLTKLKRPSSALMFEPDPDLLDLKWKGETLALIAANKDLILVAGEKQTPMIVSQDTWAIQRNVDNMGEITPRGVAVSPYDGSFAIVTDTGMVWTISPDGTKAIKPEMVGQGHVSAIAFEPDGKLWVAHHVRQADRWSLADAKSETSIRPALRTIDRVFYWIIRPIYWVNPKPSAVDETISYCLQRRQSLGFNFDTADLDVAKHQIDPWQPLWSNAIFIVLLLSFSCWYLYHQDL